MKKVVIKKMIEFERQRKKGLYIKFDDKMAPVIIIKSKYANAPKSITLKSIWQHPNYQKLQKNRITKIRLKKYII